MAVRRGRDSDRASVHGYSARMPITTVKDIMTEIVQTLRVGDTLAMARRQFERGGVHHLPVIDDDEHVIGLITYHRLLEAWLSHGRPNTESVGEVAGDIPVDMLMEKDVVTVEPKTTAAEAARLIETNRFGSLPVTKDDKLVGMVTAGDFVRFAQRHFEAERKRKPPARRAKRKSTKKAKRRASSTSRSAKGRKSR
jgi:CBS domain-containing membrane protein